MIEKLTAKLGPLPVWVWGVAIGGLLVAWQWKSRQGTSTAEAATGATDSGGETPVSTTPYGSFGTATIVQEQDPITVERTNQDWMVVAMNAIAQTNLGSSFDVQAALTRYLQGQDLSPSQKAIVDRALAAAGLPPQGVWDISNVTEVAPSPTATTRTYVTIDGAQGTIYRIEANGSLTPFSVPAWSAFRLTPTGSKVQVQHLSGPAAETARRAPKNPMDSGGLP